jgi:type II secretory pathway pseudopilin PulG
MKRFGRRTTSAAGFTLLELILAMGMVAMLSLTLYASFNVAYKAKRRAEATVRPVRAATAAIEVIAKDLENAVPPADPNNASSLFGAFLATYPGNVGAEAAWLQFHCLGDDGSPPAAPESSLDAPTSDGVRRVTIGLRTDVSPPTLVRRVTRNLRAPVEQEPEEQVLCRNVKSFAARYSDNGVDWYEEWDSSLVPNYLAPLFVQLDLVVNIEGSQQSQRQQQRNGLESQTYHVTRLVQIPLGVRT